MSSFKKSRIVVAVPFFLVGFCFLAGAIWLAVDRLMEGFEWLDSDSFTIGWLIVLVIFGGALLQFGKNALHEGHSEKSKPLIGPALYFLVGVLIIVPGLWSFIEGSSQALLVAAVGAASLGYGIRLSLKEKRREQ